MTRYLRYLTHPQVKIDPLISVPEWGLSDVGRGRAKQFASQSLLRTTKAIISSAEKKAIETAQIISDSISATIEVRKETHENDRSATGYLKANEFERVADAFFADPTRSIRGWETAENAQSRIVREMRQVVKEHEEGDILFIGHGGVGTLLLCHLAQLKISREHDQQSGGGCVFTYDLTNNTIIHAWKSIEMFGLQYGAR